MLKTPTWIKGYSIQDQKGSTSQEIHIQLDDCEVIVNMENCKFIDDGNIAIVRGIDVLEWVHYHKKELLKELESKSN